jgi:NAD(P)H-flavin reductase
VRDPLVPEPYRVRARRMETEDTWTLWLEPAGGEGFSFEPGQFTMLYAFGAGEVPISISGDPGEPGALVHTIRAVGSITEAICGLEEGEQLAVRGPFGRGWPIPAGPGEDVVVVAGGVGLAPLRPAIYALLAERERFGRLLILYGGRMPEQLLFRNEIEEWQRRDDVECEITVDAATREWPGRVGVVTKLIERHRFAPERTTSLVCGPEVMMRFAAGALVERGVEPGRLFVSMERNMRCAVGHCGHCQWGASFICRDGPVLSWSTVSERIGVREL